MLNGKVALVSGSTDGIGLAIARALASQGASVMLNGFGTRERIDTLCNDLSSTHNTRVAHIDADLFVAENAVRLVKQTESEFGRIDILVNNAGTQHKAPIEEQPPDKWDKVLALNLTAAFHTIRMALPGMRLRHWGRIINIASVYGLTGGYNRSSYIASKHGLVGLTKAVALETAATSITCNAVCPGDVSTRIFYKTAKTLAEREQISREEAQKRIAATNTPSGRAVTPEQVAATALFLCTDAAAEVRGAALSIDGGWLAS
jgi:3-hydroxybutyrate dehydrogenase